MNPIDNNYKDISARLEESNVNIHIRENFKQLKGRSGYKLEVVDGRLCQISTLGSKVRYFFQKSKIDKQVQAKVTEVLEALGKICIQDEKDPNWGLEQQEFKELFIMPHRRFQRLSHSIFDRSKIPDSIIKLLKPELYHRGEALKAKYANDPEAHYQAFFDSTEEYNFRKDSVLFAQELGVEFERNNKGSSGNYKCKDYKGKTLLLFKPSSEGPVAEENPHYIIKVRNFFLSMIPFLSRRTCFVPHHSFVAEAVASEFDRFLNIGVVPYTDIETFASKSFNGSSAVPEKTGSCTIWVDPKDLYPEGQAPEDVMQNPIEAFGLSSILPTFMQTGRIAENAPNIKIKLPKAELDKLAFIHQSLCNTDGHLENIIIIKIPKKGGGFEYRVICFDFGWSMPSISHPEDYFALKFMYEFKYLPEASQPFTNKKIIDAINEISARNLVKFLALGMKIGALYQKQVTHYHDTQGAYGTLGEMQMLLMWQRLEILRSTVELGKSIRECAEIRTQREMNIQFANLQRRRPNRYFSTPPVSN